MKFANHGINKKHGKSLPGFLLIFLIYHIRSELKSQADTLDIAQVIHIGQ